MIIYMHIGTCSATTTMPSRVSKKHTADVAFGASLGFVCAIGFAIGILLWWRHRHNQQVFFDVNGMYAIFLDDQFSNLAQW